MGLSNGHPRRDRSAHGGTIEGGRALVTGGAGTIGSTLVDRLVAAGAAEVVVLDNFVRGRRENLHWAAKKGSVAVVEGELVEERLVLGGAPVARHHGAGEVFDFDASHVHRMHQDSGTRAVSIHAYSPPLWRMGSYAVAPDGTLRRQSISYAEELRPAEAAA